jgi:preprotein translocase subunit YajC
VFVGALNGGLLIIVAVFALMYVMFIRPQQARQKAQREKSGTISPGDEVLTVGGIYGIVQELDEEGDLIVEISEGIHVRVARRAVATVVKPEEDDDVADDGEVEDAEEHDSGEAEATSPDTNPPPA